MLLSKLQLQKQEQHYFYSDITTAMITITILWNTAFSITITKAGITTLLYNDIKTANIITTVL